MAAHEPIDPRVRLAIAQWPDDAPRGAVSTFCGEHGISRKSFYELRTRARVDGPAAALEPMSRRPQSSPSKLSDQVKDQALQVRAALEASGLDHCRSACTTRCTRWACRRYLLWRHWRGPSVRPLWRDGAEEEAPRIVSAVRVPGAERMLATRRHRVRADPWAEVRDLPAHR